MWERIIVPLFCLFGRLNFTYFGAEVDAAKVDEGNPNLVCLGIV